ncbi:hypothetical protein AB205_0046750 [Aquarana catesbeiana]|uniref:Uncharacterized protein n=1 Tax=Aquarana catesbeiana TaxID=8400 RepID=A0A2G9RUI3_AQUCT|nr:hypothetical protein AB205_0046750 [Aquarana catesbeiana]
MVHHQDKKSVFLAPISIQALDAFFGNYPIHKLCAAVLGVLPYLKMNVLRLCADIWGLQPIWALIN